MMMEILSPLLIGLSVGCILGLTGAGGSIIAVPALMYFCQMPIQQAAPIALIAVAAGAILSTLRNLQLKIVRYRAAIFISIASIPSSYLGLQLAQKSPESLLKGLFILILLWIAGKTLLQSPQKNAPKQKLLTLHHQTGRYVWNRLTVGCFLALGSTTGLLTGLLGVGGGFILVPVLRHLSDLSMRTAVATSLMTISIVSCVSLFNATLLGLHAPILFSIYFAIATVLGTFVARLISAKIPESHLKSIFAWLLLLIAGQMLMEQFIL